MVKVVRIHVHGGPEVLQLEDLPLADPGPGEVVLRNEAVGLNYFDTYQRDGIYPIDLPAALGTESAGVVEAVGEAVDRVKPGDRVAASIQGAYAEALVVPVENLTPLPDGVDARVAAACLSKAMTVQALVESCYPVAAGDTVLLHAAAGGVGLIACQWLKTLGARIIGTVSTDEKAELARANGCDIALVVPRDDVVDRVKRETGGEGVPVVFDSVGNDSFETSLNSLRRRGTLVSFGQASGLVEPFRPNILAAHGSIYLTRPLLDDFIATPEALARCTGRVFEMLASGKVRIHIGQTYPLADVAQAHRDLHARKTIGSTVLLP
jgi:NADPH2:quinone reductase